MLYFVYTYLLSGVHFALQQAIILRAFKVPATIKRLALCTVSMVAFQVALSSLLGAQSYALMALFTIAQIATYKIFFNASVKFSVVYGLVQMLITIFIEALVHLLWVTLYGSVDFYNNIHIQVFLRTIVAVMLAAVYLLVRQIKIRNLENLKREKLTFWLVYLLFLFLFTSMNLINIEVNHIVVYSRIEIYNLVLFLVFFAYNVVYLRGLFKITDISQQLEMQTLYTQTLQQSTQRLRVFKHEYDNTLAAIGGYANQNDLPGLKGYLSELVQEFNEFNSVDYINQQLNHIPIANGIVLSKYSVACMNGIQFDLSIPCEIKLKYCSSVDFGRILGILLDNAMEEAMQSQQRFMELRVTQRFGVYRLVFSNSCDRDVEMEKILGDGYTTKPGHSGLGLCEITAITKKYQDLDYNMEITPHLSGGIFSMILTM